MFKRPVDQIIILLSMALLFSLFAVLGIWKQYKALPKEQSEKAVLIVPPEPEKYDYPHYDRRIAYYENWYKPANFVTETVTETSLEYSYLGYYYITAYSPQETGSWGTASGTTLHRADYENRLTEPTTCAVDRSLHRFGDLFYLPDFDRVFVAEDTGSAVKGKHLDLGYTDIESVWSFPTGWYEVYSVEYVYTDVEIQYYDFDKVQGIRRIVYLKNRYGG